jgi:2'-5' RNA ligase
MNLATTLSSTLMIVAPHEVQAIAVPILRQYAPETLIRVPAHITILYPFVPVEQLDEASEILRQVCANIVPFDITLSGFASFPGVVFMKITDPQAIRNLFHHIFAAFPNYPPYGGRFGNELNPHMTVAEFTNEARQQASKMPAYDPISFQATRIHVMYGQPGIALPWITHSVIRLGSS